VRAAARRGALVDGKLAVEPADLHYKERAGKTGTHILFVVDASGSMAARRRMEVVKAAVLSLLQRAYEQRDQVGVIAFRGVAAEVLLAPTRSVELADEALRQLPTGGRTPLAHALVLAREMLRKARQAHPDLPVLLVVLSDGKANVPLPELPGDAWAQSLHAATQLADARTPALVLDPEAGLVRLGRATQLAQALGAECLSLEQLSAQDLLLKIRLSIQ
jgi:magnesium chelatase subunit D